MKIAIIGSRGIPARYGGFETFAEILAQGLADYGHEVLVYSLPEFQSIPLSNSKISRVFIKAPRVSAIEKVSMSSFSMLHSQLRVKNDAIIFLGVSGGLAMWIPKLFGTRTIVNIDGLEWKRSRWGGFIKFALKTLERLAVRSADVVVADSEAIGRYVISEYGRDYSYIPYGVDECRYREEDWSEVKSKYDLESGNYYLIVGRHVPENNFDMIIRGFHHSKSTKRLLIVSNIRKGETRSEGNVTFTGPIYERPKLYSLRANAFAYIHGHSVGGTNPSLLEALSSKNIVLAFDVPYNREVLEDSGFYFGDEETLAALITHLEKNSADIHKENIMLFYEQILKNKYNWEIVIREYEQLLQKP